MRLRLFRVTGESMAPNYGEGDYVVTIRRRRALRAGDVVVVDHPDYGCVVKRVIECWPDGGVRVAGDNPAASMSSERLGLVARSRILGRVVWRIPHPSRMPVTG